jgi:polysaccharide deacetylase family protein (PEP-CTERM system associated)
VTITNYLTIDVEDYFQVSAFENVSPPNTWEHRESRVDRNTAKILDILQENGIRATFFVLGWVAHRFPDLIREISRQGHEVASHGYWHRRVVTQSRGDFREDICSSKKILEDLTGSAVLGYRAPSYSIGLETLWAYDELREAGYLYDSSVFPIRHDLYGIPHWPRFPFYVVRDEQNDWAPEGSRMNNPDRGPARKMLEVPITTLRFWGRNVPIAGGGYFRLLPYAVTRWGLRRINIDDERPFVFYIHPWEFDPDQPRMAGAGLKSRFRHYLNLKKTEGRFRSLVKVFSFAPLREALAFAEEMPS